MTYFEFISKYYIGIEIAIALIFLMALVAITYFWAFDSKFKHLKPMVIVLAAIMAISVISVVAIDNDRRPAVMSKSTNPADYCYPIGMKPAYISEPASERQSVS